MDTSVPITYRSLEIAKQKKPERFELGHHRPRHPDTILGSLTAPVAQQNCTSKIAISKFVAMLPEGQPAFTHESATGRRGCARAHEAVRVACFFSSGLDQAGEFLPSWVSVVVPVTRNQRSFGPGHPAQT